jgi:hypothetical protein
VEARSNLQLGGGEGHEAADLVRAEAADVDDVGGERRGVGGATSGGPAGERLEQRGVTTGEQLKQCAVCLRRAVGVARGVPAVSGRTDMAELFYDGEAGGGTRRAELGGMRWRRRSVACDRGWRSMACGRGRRWWICARRTTTRWAQRRQGGEGGSAGCEAGEAGVARGLAGEAEVSDGWVCFWRG